MVIDNILVMNALITGGSSGIGKAIAKQFSDNGIKVYLLTRNEENLRKAAEEVPNSEIVVADLRKDLNHVKEKVGGIDILVNCAGVWHSKDKVYYNEPLTEIPDEEIKEVMEVGAIAPLLLTKLFLPEMIQKKKGKIINISGTFDSGAGWLHYYVSKKAIEDFTVGLSQELEKHGIQVNCVSPSDTLTPAYEKFFPHDENTPMLNPSEVADVVSFLVSEKADNITGQTIIVEKKKVNI